MKERAKGLAGVGWPATPKESGGKKPPPERPPGPYLREGRLQHVTEDVELFEVPRLVSQIFDDWVGRKVLPEA